MVARLVVLRDQLIRGATLRLAGLLLALAPLTACEPTWADKGRSTHVDSVVPRDEAVRRFRSGLAEPARLAGGEPSRETLVRRFIGALAASDTAALVRMGVSRAEFAYLYYESSPQSLPPYDLGPALMWFTVEGKSRQDLTTALGVLGGRPIKYLGHECGEPRIEGKNRVYGYCSVRYRTAQRDTVNSRLFGLILEREGQFKFLSYGNKL